MTKFTINVNVTEGEMMIVTLLAEGNNIPEIATKLNINKRTLEKKVIVIKQKFHSTTLAGLVAIFLRNKLIE